MYLFAPSRTTVPLPMLLAPKSALQIPPIHVRALVKSDSAHDANCFVNLTAQRVALAAKVQSILKLAFRTDGATGTDDLYGSRLLKLFGKVVRLFFDLGKDVVILI
jgi:hypothetical protein